MIDREMIVKGLECCAKWMDKDDIDACNSCPYHKNFNYDDHGCLAEVNNDAIFLLKEQEQTAESTPWICHLYRCGDKRFECSWCHGTSWKASDYCPDCGTRMAEEVDMDD